MTMALCLNCGETKFGAICPCPKCQVASTGDMQLDIAFSDHNMTVKTIEQYGDIIRELGRRTQEQKIRFWAFIKYISDSPDAILHADPPAELRERVEHVLSLGTLPVVRLEKSPQVLARAKEAEKRFELEMPPAFTTQMAQAFTPSEFGGIWPVEVELHDGRILKGFQFGIFESRGLLTRGDRQYQFAASEVKAIRKAFSIAHPFRARPWISHHNN